MNKEKREITIKHDIKKAPKTGNWSYVRAEVDKEKCIGCTTCVPFCPEAAIEMKKCGKEACPPAGGDKADIDYDFCKGCGVCADVCPVKAIKMLKK